jgi:predicted O-methyltransferase YrrM
MFEYITPEIKKRMKLLESMDARDRIDGTARMKRLRQIPPETGRFLALLASNTPDGEMIEIGTSAGYSTMWLYLAAKEKNCKITTFELLPEKIKLAEETFKTAGIEQYINLIHGDVLEYLSQFSKTAFCFLDTEKEIYEECWDIISDKIVKGGVLAADNAINHRETLEPMLNKVLLDTRFDSLIVPIGSGVLISRRK